MNAEQESEQKVYLSAVIPEKDEAESLPKLYEKINETLTKAGIASFEIIFINDGSRDNSQKIIEALHKKDNRVKGIELRKNFGQTAALAAGLEYAKGELIVTMDADLQNDPADIPRMIEKLNEGYDVVSGWRKDRKDKLITRRIPSMIANRLVAKVTGVHLNDYGCALKIYRQEALKDFELYGDMHRFLPIFASMNNGVKITELVVNHHARRFGKSKYGLSRTIKVILDLITIQFFQRFLKYPMRIFGSVGILFLGVGILVGFYLSYVKIMLGESIGSRPLLLFAVLLVLAGIQLIGLGILAEILARIYFDTGKKRPYAIKKVIQ